MIYWWVRKTVLAKRDEKKDWVAALFSGRRSLGMVRTIRNLGITTRFGQMAIASPNCLTVWLDDLEAIEAGWLPSTELFYCYENEILTIGKALMGWDMLIPSEAKELGFAKAQLRPYQYDSRLNQWFVMTFHLEGQELSDCIEQGWHDAIKLPFIRIYDVREKRFTGLVVSFDIDESVEAYKEAIAAGWYPAESIEPESDFDM